MNTFQAVVLVFFGVCAMGAILVFATFSAQQGASGGPVVVWGALEASIFENTLRSVPPELFDTNDVSYEFFPAEELTEELTNAIASGRGPDLVLLPAEHFFENSEKLVPISYSTISRRDFLDTFIEAGEIYLAPEGVYGIPFSIDPFVTYWNRTSFSSAGIARAPRFWDEVAEIAPRLSKKNQAGTLSESAVALGEWDNIPHAKEILISIIRGIGDPVIRSQEGELTLTFGMRGEGNIVPSESGLRFFLEFSDPVKTVYSWSRSSRPAQDAFVAGTLALYFAPVSEAPLIRARNPNLNFDLSAYPRMRDGVGATPARLMSFSIPRGSRNERGATALAFFFAGREVQTIYGEVSGLPSVRRDMLATRPDDPFMALFREEALASFVFPDPNPPETDRILRDTITLITSGRVRLSEGVRTAGSEMQELINKVQ